MSNIYVKVTIETFSKGYLFFSALGPSAPQILSLQFQGIDWYDWDEVLKFSTKVYFKNTTYIINRRIFPILFVQGTFSTKPFVNSSIGINKRN